MWLGFPGGDSLVSIPEALDLQPLIVIRAAAVTVTDRALVLKSLFPHTAQQSLFCFVQFQRSGVDTVAKICRLRAVVKNVAQMRVALTAKRLGSAHKEAIVFFSGNIFLRHWRPETRPAGSRIKLGIRAKQLIAATAATVDALLVIIPILPGERGLCAFLSRDVKLFVRQLFLPLGIILFDLFHPSSPR